MCYKESTIQSSSLYQSETSPCRDARSVRPLYQRLQRRDFNGDGRTDRASLQGVVSILYVNVTCLGRGRCRGG